MFAFDVISLCDLSPIFTLLKVMAHGATNEKLWRERNVCCF
jgi:hypothetical protein